MKDLKESGYKKTKRGKMELYKQYLKDVEQALLLEGKMLDCDEMYQYAIGNGRRYRPMLVLTGGLIETSSYNEQMVKVGELIELIHKYSLLLDDCVDKDILRRGQKTFYYKYGTDNQQAMSAYFFYLISKVKSEIIAKANENVRGILDELINEILKDMSVGFLLDVNNSSNRSINSREVNHMLTTTLLRNSLLLGYILATDGKQTDSTIYQILFNLGNVAGDMFQSMNDLEMYINEDVQIKSKGKAYSDITGQHNNRVLELIPKEKRGFIRPREIAELALVGGYTDMVVKEVLEQKEELYKYILLLPNKSEGTAFLNRFYADKTEEITKMIEMLKLRKENIMEAEV